MRADASALDCINAHRLVGDMLKIDRNRAPWRGCSGGQRPRTGVFGVGSGFFLCSR
jgi:hypothetical protein